MSRYEIGFIYVLTNPAMPGLVKVGRSSYLAEDRAKELHTTGVPIGFDVAFRSISSRPVEVEREAHALLAPYRVASNREFFRVPTNVAIKAVKDAELARAGMDAWTGRPVHRLVSGDRVVLAMHAEQLLFAIAYRNIMDRPAAIMNIWQVLADGDRLEIFGTDHPGRVAGLSDNDPGAVADPVPYLDRGDTAPNEIIIGRERLVPGARLLWLESRAGLSNPITVTFEADCYCQIVYRTSNPQFLPNTPAVDRDLHGCWVACR